MSPEQIEEFIVDTERRAAAAAKLAKYYETAGSGSKADRDVNVARALGKASAYAHDAQILRDAQADARSAAQAAWRSSL